MSWTPQSTHITQLHPDTGTGDNDCWEASFIRYAREKGIFDAHGDQWAQINTLQELLHGKEDGADNPITTYGQAAFCIKQYGVAINDQAGYTESFDDALAAPWSILLVAAVELRPIQYPASWLGYVDAPDHFILWLPRWQGTSDWFNDPLAPVNQDVQYDLASVRAAFSCAYLLPQTAHGELGPSLFHTVQRCALKATPSHASVALEMLGRGITVRDLALPLKKTDDTWRRVRSTDGKSGWVPASVLRAA